MEGAADRIKVFHVNSVKNPFELTCIWEPPCTASLDSTIILIAIIVSL